MVHLMSITIRVTSYKSIMETPHKHHIVPTYKCIELGLTTSYKIGGKEFYFKENMVEVPREHHALIHWGYWCNGTGRGNARQRLSFLVIFIRERGHHKQGHIKIN